MSVTSVLLGYVRTSLLFGPFFITFGRDWPRWMTGPLGLVGYGVTHLLSYAGRGRAYAIEEAVAHRQW